MNRIITILVTIFILLLLYIWISHVWGSDEERHPRQIVDARQTELSDEMPADTTYSSSDDTYGDQDEFATERKTTPGAEEFSTSGDVKTDPPKAVESKTSEPKSEPVTQKVSTPPATQNKPVSTPAKPASTPVTSASSSGGKHLVIAGNFTQLVNAQQRVQELKKAGFPEAEVVNFDLSEYHTVCAGRFSDVNEARRLVKKLKDYHKIDAYVRIGS